MNLFLTLPTCLEYKILQFAPHPLAVLIKNQINDVNIIYSNEVIEYPNIFFDFYVYKEVEKLFLTE